MMREPSTTKFHDWLARVEAERAEFDATAPIFSSEVHAEDVARNSLQATADVSDRALRRIALLAAGIWVAPDPDFVDESLSLEVKAWIYQGGGRQRIFARLNVPW